MDWCIGGLGWAGLDWIAGLDWAGLDWIGWDQIASDEIGLLD